MPSIAEITTADRPVTALVSRSISASPAGEVRDVARQRVQRGPRLVPAQQPFVQFAQVRAWIRAQLLGQQHPHVLERLQRLGGPARPVQRVHELQPQLFPQRELLGQPSQLPDQPLALAQLDRQARVLLGDREPAFLQQGQLGFQARPDHEAVQRRAPPQRERLLVPGDRRAVITLLQRLVADSAQLLEDVDVDLACRHLQPVAAGHRDEVVQHELAHGGDVGANVRFRCCGWRFPHRFNQMFKTDRLVGMQGQRRQQRPLPGPAQPQFLAPTPDLQRPKRPIPH
nr:hypothetical protein [Lentzea indica]